MNRLAITCAEAGDLLGVSARTVQRLVAKDAIPHLRIGTRVRIPLAALELWCLDTASSLPSGGLGGVAGRSVPATGAREGSPGHPSRKTT